MIDLKEMRIFKLKDYGKPVFLPTLDGSGVAASQLMVALLENNQQEDGSVLVPKALERYLGEGISKITPAST